MIPTCQILNYEVQIKELAGQRVITFKDIDLVHGRPEGTARKRFNDNEKHFIEGEDFFKIQKSEKRTLGLEIPNRGLTLITESGYLMLVKSFTDDLAWKVQRELVNNYFRVREIVKVMEQAAYAPKATSVGEVVKLINLTRQSMQEQGCAPHEIAVAVKSICEQFNIQLPDCFIKPKETSLQDAYGMIDFVFRTPKGHPKPTYEDYVVYQATVKMLNR